MFFFYFHFHFQAFHFLKFITEFPNEKAEANYKKKEINYYIL